MPQCSKQCGIFFGYMVAGVDKNYVLTLILKSSLQIYEMVIAISIV